MNFYLAANVSLQNLIGYINIYGVKVSNTNPLIDNIGLLNLDYDSLFTALFTDIVSDFNIEYENGYPLANIDPRIGFAGTMFTNTTATPFQENGFIYAGFTFISDTSSPTFRMEEKFGEHYNEDLRDLIKDLCFWVIRSFSWW